MIHLKSVKLPLVAVFKSLALIQDVHESCITPSGEPFRVGSQSNVVAGTGTSADGYCCTIIVSSMSVSSSESVLLLGSGRASFCGG